MAKYLDATGVSTLWGKIKSSFASSSHNHDATYLKLSGGTLSGGIIFKYGANTSDQLIQFSSTDSSDSQTVYLGIRRPLSSYGPCYKDNSGNWYSLIHTGNYGSYCAPLNHTHQYLLATQVNTTSGENTCRDTSGVKLGLYCVTGSGVTTSPTGDGYILSFNYASQYCTQIAVDLDPTYKLAIRNWKNDRDWNAWKNILTSDTTYISSGVGYIGGTEISQVSNSNKVGGYSIDSFKKSGENLIKGSSCASISGWSQSGWGGGISTVSAEDGIYKMYSQNGWRSLYYTLPSDYSGKQVSFSFDVKYVSSESTENASGYYVGSTNSLAGSNDFKSKLIADTWVHVSGVLTLSATPWFTISIRGSDQQNKTCVLNIKNLKVELGDLPTIWTPSPSDIGLHDLSNSGNNISLRVGNTTKTLTVNYATTSESAAKLGTQRSLKVNLASTSAQGFDGSSDATNIGVSGTLPFANLPNMYWGNIAVSSSANYGTFPVVKYLSFKKNESNDAAGWVGTGSSSNNDVGLFAYSGNLLKLGANGNEAVRIDTPNTSSTHDIPINDANNWYYIGTVMCGSGFTTVHIYVGGKGASMNNSCTLFLSNIGGWGYSRIMFAGVTTNTTAFTKVGFYDNRETGTKVYIYIKDSRNSSYNYTGYSINVYYDSSKFAYNTPTIVNESEINSTIDIPYKHGIGNIVADLKGNATSASSVPSLSNSEIDTIMV